MEAAELRLTSAESELTTLQASGTATQEDLDTAELAVEQAQADVSNLQTDLGVAQQDISDLQSDVETKAAQTDLEAAELRLTSAESELTTLQASGTATQEDLDTAELAVEQAQADITNIQDQLEGVATSAELEGLATTEDVETVRQEVQEVATLFGRDANLLTQEEVDLAQSFLNAAEFEYNALYDVDKSGTFDVADTALMQSAVDSGDYSGFVDSEFGPATGMVAQQQERDAAAEALRRDQELEYQAELEAQDAQNRQNQIARDAALRADFQRDLAEQADEERREEFARALNAPGRKVTEQQAPLTDIGYIYDFGGDSIFANQQQQRFFDSASAYGDNFLTDIITPQQRRAKGGMIKDTTDEILKIIGDK